MSAQARSAVNAMRPVAFAKAKQGDHRAPELDGYHKAPPLNIRIDACDILRFYCGDTRLNITKLKLANKFVPAIIGRYAT
jgi:hypothetical protein